MKLICAFLALSLSLSSLAEELVVYTSRNEHLIKDLFEQYQKKTGIKINYRTGEAGALIQALKAEGERTPADIFMTVDAGNLGFATEQGLLQPIQSETLSSNIPPHLRDPQGHWFALSIRARTMVYNTQKVQPSELSTYEDLAAPKWKGRLCLRTSKKVYNQSLVAMLISELGSERALEVVSGWAQNAVEIFANDTAVLKAIAAGQCDVGLVNTYYFGRLIEQEKDLPLAIFWPNQKDSYGVHINVSGAGIVKHSKRAQQAQKFLEWLASEEAQREYAQVNMEYAILEDKVKQHPLVQSWGDFKPNTSFNLSEAGKRQQEAIQLIHHARYK